MLIIMRYSNGRASREIDQRLDALTEPVAGLK